MSIKTSWLESPSPQILKFLVKGDKFKELRNVTKNGEMTSRKLTHTLMTTPVFMEYSKNWTCRVLSDVDPVRGEYIYINKLNIVRFSFRDTDLMFYLSQRKKKVKPINTKK